jgi:phospholipase/lecithinase/hemolysin
MFGSKMFAPGKAYAAVKVKESVMACLLATLLSTGCSIELKEKAPNAASKDSIWLVHCETAESHRPNDEKINKGVSKPHWLLSLDQTGSPYQLQGSLEDGFLTLDEDQPSEEALRLGCIAALEASTREHGNEIAKILAFRQHEGVNVSIDFPKKLSEDHIQRLVIFGDSLSDTGNLKSRLRMFPASPYWIGRFSNGPAWPDYIDAMNPLAVQNHAVGGASVTGKDTQPKGSFSQRMQDGGQFFVSGTTQKQISVYAQDFLVDGQLLSPEKTAVVLWAGANDYISKEPFTGAIETLLDRPELPEGYPAVVDAVVSRMELQILSLVDFGVDKMLVGNLPNLGLSPIVVENNTYGIHNDLSEEERRSQLSLRLTELTTYHNEQLALMIDRVNRETPDASIVLFDSFGLFEDVLSDTATNYKDVKAEADFDVAKNAQRIESQIHTVVAQERCFRGSYMGSKNPSEICANSNRAIFWDVVHPTTYVHCWVAYTVNQQLADLSWVASAPVLDDVGEWCAGVADVVAGHEELRVLRFTTVDGALAPLPEL